MATGRFPERVEAVLRAAGWHEGRDIGAAADEMIDQVVAQGRAEGVELAASPAVSAALHEFGGLTVTREGTGVAFPGNDFAIDPVRVARKFEVYAELDRIIGGGSFPLGPEFAEHSALAIGPDGRVFLFHHTGFYIVGDTLDAALANWIERTGTFTDIFDVYDEPDDGE